MDNLVTTDGNKAFTTTLIIAEGVQTDHRSVFRLLKTYEEDLNDLDLSRFEIAKVSTKGRSTEYAKLSEIQATFLITLMKNTKKVVQFKKQLTKEFFKQRDFIAKIKAQQQNEQWLESRKQGRIARRLETDVIKEFIAYSKAQGGSPKGCDRYYNNLSTMESKALFILEQKYKNLRNILGITELLTVQQADMIVAKALKDGMTDKLHYKDIYSLAKKRVELFAEIRGKSSLEYLSMDSNAPPPSLTQH